MKIRRIVIETNSGNLRLSYRTCLPYGVGCELKTLDDAKAVARSFLSKDSSITEESFDRKIIVSSGRNRFEDTNLIQNPLGDLA